MPFLSYSIYGPNLAKSLYRWPCLMLHHRIEEKKTLFWSCSQYFMEVLAFLLKSLFVFWLHPYLVRGKFEAETQITTHNPMTKLPWPWVLDQIRVWSCDFLIAKKSGPNSGFEWWVETTLWTILTWVQYLIPCK